MRSVSGGRTPDDCSASRASLAARSLLKRPGAVDLVGGVGAGDGGVAIESELAEEGNGSGHDAVPVRLRGLARKVPPQELLERCLVDHADALSSSEPARRLGGVPAEHRVLVTESIDGSIDVSGAHRPWQRLYFWPDPPGQGSFRPTLSLRTGWEN